MKKFAFLALFAVLLSQPVFAEIELKASAQKASEAVAIDFSIDSIDSIEELEIEWDFGDGSGEKTSYPFSSHAFYLSPGTELRETFSVKATVFSGGELAGSDSIGVTVERASFKPRLVLPIPLPGKENELSKTGQSGSPETHEASLYFQGEAGNDLDAESVEILEASIGESAFSFEKKAIGGRDYFFTGSFESSSSFKTVEKLFIKASFGGTEKMFSLPVFFSPLKITAENPFTEELSLGSEIGKKKFELRLPTGQQPTAGEFSVELFREKMQLEKKSLSFNGSWSADFNHVVSGEDLAVGLRISLNGLGENGNHLNESFEIPLLKTSPGFRVLVISPFSGQSGELGLGQNAFFSIEPREPKELENGSFFVECSGIGKKELKKAGNQFSAFVQMPETGNRVSCILSGSAESNGKRLYFYRQLTANLSNNVGIEFIYPSEEAKFVDPGGLLRVRLTRPNNEPLLEKEVNAVLAVDGKEFEALLEKAEGKSGQYAAKLPVSALGKHKYSLALTEFSGSASIEAELREFVDWTLPIIAGIALIVSAGFALYFFCSRKKNIKLERLSMENRLLEIKTRLKQARVDFFKRKLTESEYRDTVLKLKQEREQLLEGLGVKEKKK